MRVLVAGGSGALGREVIQALARRGHRVRALARDPRCLEGLPVVEVRAADALQAPSLRGVCDEVDAVFSCMGASVSLDAKKGRAPFGVVDVEANRNLLAEAQRSGRPRFVYVSVFRAEEFPQFAYMRAHQTVADAVEQSGLPFAIIRPVGFFSALGAFLALARSGPLPEVRGGRARSNPIHDADLAEVCVDALEGKLSERIDVGGPEIFTRHEIAELAFRVVGRPPRFRRTPAALLPIAGWLTRPFNPRLGELIPFYAAVMQNDFIAPAHGMRKLGAYFAELAQSGSVAGSARAA